MLEISGQFEKCQWPFYDTTIKYTLPAKHVGLPHTQSLDTRCTCKAFYIGVSAINLVVALVTAEIKKNTTYFNRNVVFLHE